MKGFTLKYIVLIFCCDFLFDMIDMNVFEIFCNFSIANVLYYSFIKHSKCSHNVCKMIK